MRFNKVIKGMLFLQDNHMLYGGPHPRSNHAFLFKRLRSKKLQLSVWAYAWILKFVGKMSDF